MPTEEELNITSAMPLENTPEAVWRVHVQFGIALAEKTNERSLNEYLRLYDNLKLNYDQQNRKGTIPVPAKLKKFVVDDDKTMTAHWEYGPELVIDPLPVPWELAPAPKPMQGVNDVGAQAGAKGIYARGPNDTASIGSVTTHPTTGEKLTLFSLGGKAVNYRFLYATDAWLNVFRHNPTFQGG